jgi:hypothetical protein
MAAEVPLRGFEFDGHECLPQGILPVSASEIFLYLASEDHHVGYGFESSAEIRVLPYVELLEEVRDHIGDVNLDVHPELPRRNRTVDAQAMV